MKTPTKPTAKQLEIPGRILSTNDEKFDIDFAAAARAFASKDMSFLIGLAVQLANLDPGVTVPDIDKVAFTASIVAGIAPRDTVEVLLATQMAGIHNAIMMMNRRLMMAPTVDQQDSTERALNKLVRTFAMQVLTLQRYRGVGQGVPIQHVAEDDADQPELRGVPRPKRGGRNDQPRRLN